jgi:ferredoxin
MPLDLEAVRRACPGSSVVSGRQLCRAELARVRALGAEAGTVLVACTQEAPLFEEVAEEAGFAERVRFANIRETAGWAREARAAGAKQAALLAVAALPPAEPPLVPLRSEGVVLVYGRDETALEAARQLADRLEPTVLLREPAEVLAPRVTAFPVLQGTIRRAAGHLGAFEVTVDDHAAPVPSSRGFLRFGPGCDGAVLAFDIILDLTGGPPLFPAPDLRPGYLRADPGDPAAVQRALFTAAGLTGEFDKPRYVQLREGLCAHARSQITGCSRCLEVCPTGAITPAGDHVAIDEAVCAGCGSCHAVCPTGAASYLLPPSELLLTRLRTLLLTYREAGGQAPVLLLHDGEHGAELIHALARFGDGLPARVLPLEINSPTQLGIEAFAAALAYGATAVRVLQRARPRHDTLALERTLGLARALAAGLGYGEAACGTIDTDDPDGLAESLAGLPRGPGPVRPASFLPLGDKRGLMRTAVRELQAAASAPAEVLPLPAGAPFGRVQVEVEGCTLCLACVAACPTKALSDDPDRPTLRFTEAACVQCGLCAATCPEKVIRLEPRFDFRPQAGSAVVLKEEEPFACIACGKPFGTRSTIERIAAKLEGRHWMFEGPNSRRLDLIRMCEDCRVTAVTNDSLDPYGAPPRPKPRTTEDYLRERAQKDGGTS